MADTAQINPKIPLATKVRLLEFCKDRGHAQGEVVAAALEGYFTPADGDAQTLMLQKINSLEQGMKDVVTLLDAVVQQLERHVKPPPPRMATPIELYPALRLVQEDVPPHTTVEELEPFPIPKGAFWRAVFRRAKP